MLEKLDTQPWREDSYSRAPKNFEFQLLQLSTEAPRTGGSVGWASGCHARGREFNSRRTIPQGLKIIEEKVLPFQFHLHMVRLSSLLG